MAQSASTVARFLREAQATVQLKSEHIARVNDVGTLPDGTPVMVMEYLTGNDLNQILRHHGPQSPAIVCDLMLQACEGMAEAHAAGIVHRDIKPSNFFITQRPDGSMLLKILDFGISKTPVGVGDLTGTQAVLGTPTYMAPEQMRSGRAADARSDVWSMGVVMYQLLAGRPPFNGESYAALVLQVNGEPPSPLHVPLPAGLGEVIFRCLEKDPRDRHQNVGDLARMIAPFASDPATAAIAAGRATRTLQHRGRGARAAAHRGRRAGDAGAAVAGAADAADLAGAAGVAGVVDLAGRGPAHVPGPRLARLARRRRRRGRPARRRGRVHRQRADEGRREPARRARGGPAASPDPVETPDPPPAPPPAAPDQQAASTPPPTPPRPRRRCLRRRCRPRRRRRRESRRRREEARSAQPRSRRSWSRRRRRRR